MKKIIFIIIPIILILLAVFIVVVYNKNEKQTEFKNISTTTETFTITDNGTEIDVLIKNNNVKEIIINEIDVNLYNSQNKKIKTINYNKKIIIKSKQQKIIKIKT